ncbi:MAG: GntR family transcriptional regulator [Phycisphaeraceae bacterium]|nr:GntR family transcriptional regulator [Phycisphaeraceae bacterium]
MTQTPLRDQAYAHIRSRLLSGNLPAGTRLSEISVANEMGISKTPVREAIRRLEVEGLLEQVPRVGTIVRTPSRRQIIELYEYREALENHAILLAIDRIKPKELELMERMCQRLRQIAVKFRESGQATLSKEMIEEALSVDLAFHMVILCATSNQKIVHEVERSRVLTQILCMSRYHKYALWFICGTYLYHSRILRELKKKKAESARFWMSRHIRISQKEALADFDLRQREGEPSERFPLSLPLEVRKELEDLG